MNVLTTVAGGAGEMLALLTQQGDAVPVQLSAPSSLPAGVLTPLSSALFVDGGSTATGTPNGSIGNPFLTVQEAVDAAAAGTTIYIAAADPYGNVTIGAKNLSLIGLIVPGQQPLVGDQSPNIVTLGDVVAGSNLQLQNLSVASVTATGFVVQLDAVACGDVDCDTLIGTAPLVQPPLTTGAITVVGANSPLGTVALQLHNYTIDGAISSTSGVVLFSDADPNSSISNEVGVINATDGAIELHGMGILGNVHAASTVLITDCEFQNALTVRADAPLPNGIACTVYDSTKSNPSDVITFVAGTEGSTLLVDWFSHQWLNNAVTATFELVAVAGAAPKAVLNVVVPAVADGDVGYANVDTTGTELDGLATTDVVVGNPSADLVAAGAGGGFIGCRVSAAHTIRCAFLGPLAGGTVSFAFCRLTRANLS